MEVTDSIDILDITPRHMLCFLQKKNIFKWKIKLKIMSGHILFVQYELSSENHEMSMGKVKIVFNQNLIKRTTAKSEGHSNTWGPSCQWKPTGGGHVGVSLYVRPLPVPPTGRWMLAVTPACLCSCQMRRGREESAQKLINLTFALFSCFFSHRSQ